MLKKIFSVEGIPLEQNHVNVKHVMVVVSCDYFVRLQCIIKICLDFFYINNSIRLMVFFFKFS